MSNNVILHGSISVSNTNVPTRAGQRITTLNELKDIPTPFIGMIIYVLDLDVFIYVKSLKSKKVGNFEIKNALIDLYEMFASSTGELIWNEVL